MFHWHTCVFCREDQDEWQLQGPKVQQPEEGVSEEGRAVPGSELSRQQQISFLQQGRQRSGMEAPRGRPYVVSRPPPL